MQDLVTSAIRTFVPYVAGAVIGWLTTKGLHVSSANVASITALVTFLVGTLYYVVVRSLEKKWPKLGVLLGVPTQPKYGA